MERKAGRVGSEAGEARRQSAHEAGKDTTDAKRPCPPPPGQGPYELHVCMGLNSCACHDVNGTAPMAGLGECATVNHARIDPLRRAVWVSERHARASAMLRKLFRIVRRSRGEKTWAWKAGRQRQRPASGAAQPRAWRTVMPSVRRLVVASAMPTHVALVGQESK